MSWPSYLTLGLSSPVCKMGRVVLTFLELRSELTGVDEKCPGVPEEPAGLPGK